MSLLWFMRVKVQIDEDKVLSNKKVESKIISSHTSDYMMHHDDKVIKASKYDRDKRVYHYVYLSHIA